MKLQTKIFSCKSALSVEEELKCPCEVTQNAFCSLNRCEDLLKLCFYVTMKLEVFVNGRQIKGVMSEFTSNMDFVNYSVCKRMYVVLYTYICMYLLLSCCSN